MQHRICPTKASTSDSSPATHVQSTEARRLPWNAWPGQSSTQHPHWRTRPIKDMILVHRACRDDVEAPAASLDQDAFTRGAKISGRRPPEGPRHDARCHTHCALLGIHEWPGPDATCESAMAGPCRGSCLMKASSGGWSQPSPTGVVKVDGALATLAKKLHNGPLQPVLTSRPVQQGPRAERCLGDTQSNSEGVSPRGCTDRADKKKPLVKKRRGSLTMAMHVSATVVSNLLKNDIVLLIRTPATSCQAISSM